MSDKQVLLISEKGAGFSIKAIYEAMSKKNINVNSISIYDKKIVDYITQVALVVIVDSSDQDITLYKIEHICSENEKPVFLYGTANEINDFRTVFTDENLYREFLRPVNLDDFAEQALSAISSSTKKAVMKKILVVDDNGVFLRTVMGWLEGKYEVALANSASSAIRSIDRSKPDMILLDYEMPVCSGAQFMEMLAADDEYKSIPVIFLTSRCDPQTVKEVMLLRPLGYILKSTPQFELLKTIEKYFEKM